MRAGKQGYNSPSASDFNQRRNDTRTKDHTSVRAWNHNIDVALSVIIFPNSALSAPLRIDDLLYDLIRKRARAILFLVSGAVDQSRWTFISNLGLNTFSFPAVLSDNLELEASALTKN